MAQAHTLNHSFPLRGQGLSTAEDGAEQPRHRWYYVKESFSPALIQTAINQSGVSDGAVLLDPFCGSGTTPLAGAQHGLKAWGLEVNPFLAFVSATKLKTAETRAYLTDCDNVLERTKTPMASSLEGFSTFTYSRTRKKWLFNRGVLRAFEAGWRASEGLRGRSRGLVRLALLGAAMDACNAVRDGKCLRYRSDWKDRGFDANTFRDCFEQRATQIAEDIAKPLPIHPPGKVLLGDSRSVLPDKIGEKFDLCVTSPPYLNSFDYTDIYRPELFLGRFVTTMKELRDLRFRTVRSHVQVDWSRAELNLPSALAKECSKRVRDVGSFWDTRIPHMIDAYFEDLYLVLLHLRRLAAEGAQLWLVVSTSAYGGVEVPVDLVLAELGSACGWDLREVGVLRQLRSSGQHWATLKNLSPPLRESVVIFRAKPRKQRWV